ncbi:hypothetical protein K501DRAFT_267182 [Backusella circina FSU 941]|nr:hypothetical protein K501DRAFT_267182 [Backusella circina FSU 941]
MPKSCTFNTEWVVSLGSYKIRVTSIKRFLLLVTVVLHSSSLTYIYIINPNLINLANDTTVYFTVNAGLSVAAAEADSPNLIKYAQSETMRETGQWRNLIDPKRYLNMTKDFEQIPFMGGCLADL